MDINEIRSKLSNLKKSINPSLGLEKGISIVIPVYSGIDYLDDSLSSINNQIITTAKFEVIIVLKNWHMMIEHHLEDSEFFLSIHQTELDTDS